jgi:hypothetical protein
MIGPTEPDDDAVRRALNEALAADTAAIAAAARAVLVDEREVDAVLQAQAVHSLIRNDPAMPPKLRAMLVTYAGRLLDEARPIVLTPEAITALERRPR